MASGEILTPPEDVTDGLAAYGKRLKEFAHSREIPDELLREPDHVMIKSANTADFAAVARGIHPWAEQVVFTEIDLRFLVAARLLVPLALTDNHYVGGVEVMESRSEAVDFLGLEYGQFFVPDFKRAERLIRRRKIPFQSRADNHHRWLQLPMNNEGQELRLSDKKLDEIIDEELAEGAAKLL